MGNDGGSIPGRAELVKPKKKEIRVESELVAKFRAKYCALSKERLRKPVAVCRIGYLYNYDTLLKALMEKRIPKELKHLKSIKNVKELNTTENPDKNNEFPFVCPISQTSLNGKNKFYLLWNCGCVFNEKIIRDLGIKDKKCPLCTKQYTKDDIVELCPTNEDAEIRKAQIYKQLEEKQKLQQQKEQCEQQQKKKICTEESKQEKKQEIKQSKFQQLQNQEEEIKNNEIYKSLFHNSYSLEDNLFTRNVRFGNR